MVRPTFPRGGLTSKATGPIRLVYDRIRLYVGRIFPSRGRDFGWSIRSDLMASIYPSDGGTGLRSPVFTSGSPSARGPKPTGGFGRAPAEFTRGCGGTW
jgi:hypothetical protein